MSPDNVQRAALVTSADPVRKAVEVRGPWVPRGTLRDPVFHGTSQINCYSSSSDNHLHVTLRPELAKRRFQGGGSVGPFVPVFDDDRGVELDSVFLC